MSITFRAHMVGKLMTEPRSKSEGPLSQGAKSAIRDLAAQDILGINFEVSSRELEKGNECEPEAVALLNRVRGLSLTKNAERLHLGGIGGECDLFDSTARHGYDLKCAWSAATFPILAEDIGGSQRNLYEWQCRAYMALWDADKWTVAYALVNTPERLIGYEPQSMHFFDHIPEHMRLTLWTIERCAQKEFAMFEKVAQAQAHYSQVLAEFDRTHQPLAAQIATRAHLAGEHAAMADLHSREAA
jgi:hypothetical protein